ncbi:MAG: hypothetical protein ACR2QC_04635 [Gammaproteobacteria bacterium]
MAALFRYNGTFTLLIKIHHSGESRNLLRRFAAKRRLISRLAANPPFARPPARRIIIGG